MWECGGRLILWPGVYVFRYTCTYIFWVRLFEPRRNENLWEIAGKTVQHKQIDRKGGRKSVAQFSKVG